MSYVRPSGVDIGSLRWQPVFFSGIALVVGVQALLAGAILAYHSSVIPGVHLRFGFVGSPVFSRRCFAGGILLVAAGLAINLVFFLVWVEGDSSTPRSFGHASLAQSLIIAGARSPPSAS